MWGAVKEWLKTASVPQDKQLRDDLVGPRVKPDSSGKLFLESKKEMKARGLASPDAADAIAVTFAFPVNTDASGMSYSAAAPSYYAKPVVNFWGTQQRA
jgi:hypothetical protein